MLRSIPLRMLPSHTIRPASRSLAQALPQWRTSAGQIHTFASRCPNTGGLLGSKHTPRGLAGSTYQKPSRSLLKGPLTRSYQSYGSHSSTFTPDQAFWLLFGVNASVFGTIMYCKYTDNRRLLSTVLDNTSVSVHAWDSGRWWTVLTSAFTHHGIGHLVFNMVTLNAMCGILAWVPGVTGFHVLALALGSGVAGSGLWLAQQKTRLAALEPKRGSWSSSTNTMAMQRIEHSFAIGASGIVMGVGALATCLVPSAPMYLMLIPVSIPLWCITIGYGLFDTFYLDDPKTNTAHAGHLGGLAFGVAYYIARFRKSPMGVWQSVRGMLRRR